MIGPKITTDFTTIYKTYSIGIKVALKITDNIQGNIRRLFSMKTPYLLI